MKRLFVLAVIAAFLAEPILAQTWSLVQSMPTGRIRHCSEAGVDSSGTKRIYVFSGGSESSAYSSVYGYDPISNSWATFANIPTPRVLATSTTLSGKIYVIGGFNGGFSNGMSTVEVYDPPTDTWSSVANLPVTTSESAAASSGGKVYVFGGYQPNSGITLNKTYEYDPGTNVWTQKANMPGPARGIGAARACNGKIYVIGNNVNYEYNPTTNTWATKAVAPTTQGGRAVVIGSDQRIYLINDRNYNTSSDPVVYYYRFTNNTWYAAPNNIKGYTVPAVAHQSNRLYLTGGTVRFSPLTDRVEKSTALASCSCWHSFIMCAVKAVAHEVALGLRLSEIQAGGGVVLESEDTTRFDMSWDMLNATEGTSVTLAANGFVNGVQSTETGNLIFAGSPEGVSIQADFTTLKATTWRAEAFDGGKLVAVFEGQGAIAGAIAERWPSGSGVSQSERGESSLNTRFENATLIRINDQPVLADEIRLIAQDGMGFDFINSYSLTANELDEINITEVLTGEGNPR